MIKPVLSEPYYCFYLWLKRKKRKLLYPDVDLPYLHDRITMLFMT
jgi:hypothetical protein